MTKKILNHTHDFTKNVYSLTINQWRLTKRLSLI